ncbi:MAG: methylcobamide--CoM methyltransferase [Armatimonadetes bacterium]|nr:methylcobamide--CoM methyltransferase [Armatimonadota bacterium]MDW8122135.1 methylcobamide--CoM methyltransferase [Armatimonadota bacterium]
MTVTVVDTYPKVSEEDQRLRRALAAFEDGRIDGEELDRVATQVAETVIKEQVEAGVQLVTDGLIRWDDPISYLGQKLAGTKRGGLLRWFDNNFYFRQPVIVGKLERPSPMLVDEWKKASQAAYPTPVKPVLTGPFTFVVHCLNEYYPSFENLLEEVTDLWKQEIKDLADAGAPLVQINEPSILFHPDNTDLWMSSLRRLAEDSPCLLSLYTFFADPSAVYDSILSLPFPIIGLDFCSGEENRTWELIKDCPKDKTFACGIVDARNIRAEPVDQLARQVDDLLDRLGEEIHFNPNCGLEFLPRSDARNKLRHLAQAVSQVAGDRRLPQEEE